MITEKLKHDWDQYKANANETYAHQIALKLHPLVNSNLGGRNAGSDAEHRAAEILYLEMKAIGLKEVTRHWFPVVKWQFNDCTLTLRRDLVHEEIQLKPYAYPSGSTPPEGVEAPLIYAGRGTKQELDRLEVKGRILLLDIDMREDWWITYPALEAAFRGAAGVIASCCGGFAMENDDALNCQDFVGPQTIPCVSVSRRQAAQLKERMIKGPMTVNLMVDAVLDNQGTSCNLTGVIPGKNTAEQVIVGDHYDCHFWGFQDNNMAVGLTLAIAKGILDAEIVPERTLVFILHGAEESGALDSRYDWSVGAWHQINRLRPDWAGNTLVYINFELPACHFGHTNYTAAAPELFHLLNDFKCQLPEDLQSFKDDPYEVGFQQYSWSDDWSYTAAGVPGMVNGFLVNKKGQVNQFFVNKYHSQFDDPDTYDASMAAYNLILYGCMTLFLAARPIWTLDFISSIHRLENSLHPWMDQVSPVEMEQYRLTLGELKRRVETIQKELDQLNQKIIRQGQLVHEASVLELNGYLLFLFKRWQDLFLRLDWTDTPIVGHQHYASNGMALEKALAHLRQDEGDQALESLCLIEDEVISRYFSREVVNHFTKQVRSPERQDHLLWGTGRVMDHVDLYDVINSVQDKLNHEEKAGWELEINQLERHQDEQLRSLSGVLVQEIEGLAEMLQYFEGLELERLMAYVEEGAR